MAFRPRDELKEDKRLRRMIFVSAIIHAAVIVWLVVGASFGRSELPRPVAFTVDLVNSAALGTNLPGGGKNQPRTEPIPVAPKTPPPVAPPLQPKVAPPPPPVVRKEEPKAPVPMPVKEKPVEVSPAKPVPEKVQVPEKPPEAKKPEPPKAAKIEDAKPEPKKVIAKAEEPKPEAKKPEPKTQPEKVEPKKAEDNKPPPPQTAVKPKKEELQPEVKKPETKSAPVPPQLPKVAPQKTAQEKPESTDTAEERDRQIAAALERVRTQVQPPKGSEKREAATDEVKGKGPETKGGEAGEGGGGVVRGLEFIMYTQQLQQLVQESWIVTEKNPELVATVSFKIEPDGTVQEIELSTSSGDVAFDQSVLRAVRKAAPFPPPPVSYAEEFAAQKIVMNFGGEGRVN